MKGLYFQEDAAHVRRVAAIFGCAPCMIADECGVSPVRIEQLMQRRGQIREGDERSLLEKIEEFYGKSAAKTVISYGINFLKMTNKSKEQK